MWWCVVLSYIGAHYIVVSGGVVKSIAIVEYLVALARGRCSYIVRISNTVLPGTTKPTSIVDALM